MTLTCRICRESGPHRTFVFHERMFGWGDAFEYFQCRGCGCLQIASVPADLSRFYPDYYYSFHLHPLPQLGLKAWFAAKRDFSAATGGGILGKLLALWVPPRIEVACLGRVPLRRDMRVLDVGCGRGQLLSILRRAGFPNLLGVDPYLPSDIEVLPGLRVLKREVQSVEERFDCVMLHHVFEHLEHGLQMLIACRDRLLPGGRIVLRVPTVECEAWERYGEFWVALDAPRHLMLHTRASLKLLVRRSGLKIMQCWCDSTGFQFQASELYRKGIPLTDAQGTAVSVGNYFTRRQLRKFDRESAALNKSERGDQLVAVLAVDDFKQD